MHTRYLEENFNPGDLLYRLKAYRKAAQAIIHRKCAELPTIADEYNAVLIAQFTDGGEAEFIKNSDYLKKFQQLDFPFQAHLLSLETASVPKVRISNNTGPTASYGKIIKKLDMEERRTRRACKAALLRPDIAKHFLLDGINPLDIFDREYSLKHTPTDAKRCRL